MKAIIFILVLFSSLSLFAQKSINPFVKRSGGSESGGGGDLKTERRIKDIRDDILEWINQGGARDLRFSGKINYSDYLYGNAKKGVYGMLEALLPGAVTITAFNRREKNPSKRNLNTIVYGSPKVCKGYIEDGEAYIVCSKEKFWELSDSEQYQQVHHEYAGLARLERNNKSDSDYSLSSQITDYLEEKKVLKLAIKKRIRRLKETPTFIEYPAHFSRPFILHSNNMPPWGANKKRIANLFCKKFVRKYDNPDKRYHSREEQAAAEKLVRHAKALSFKIEKKTHKELSYMFPKIISPRLINGDLNEYIWGTYIRKNGGYYMGESSLSLNFFGRPYNPKEKMKIFKSITCNYPINEEKYRASRDKIESLY